MYECHFSSITRVIWRWVTPVLGKGILNTDCSGAANRESLHAVDTFSSSKLYIYSSTKEDPKTNNELFVNW